MANTLPPDSVLAATTSVGMAAATLGTASGGTHGARAADGDPTWMRHARNVADPGADTKSRQKSAIVLRELEVLHRLWDPVTGTPDAAAWTPAFATVHPIVRERCDAALRTVLRDLLTAATPSAARSPPRDMWSERVESLLTMRAGLLLDFELYRVDVDDASGRGAVTAVTATKGGGAGESKSGGGGGVGYASDDSNGGGSGGGGAGESKR